LVVTMILTAVVAIVGLEVLAGSTQHVADVMLDDSMRVGALELDAERLVSASRAYLLTGDDLYKRRLRDLDVVFDGGLARIRSLGVSDVTQLTLYARAYLDAVKRAVERGNRAGDQRVVVALFDHELVPLRIAFERALEGIASRDRAAFELARERGGRLRREVELTIVATSALAIAFGILLSLWFVRTSTRQQRSLDESLVRAKRVAASREELMTMVSHDLRTPLQTIVLAAASLRDGRSTDRERHVVAVENAAERMIHLVDDLLDLARIESGEIELRPQPCETEKLLRDASELFRDRASELGVVLRVDAPAARGLIADRERVLQVLANLIGNALRFAGPGGTVRVSAAERDCAVRFAVEDTGPGIPRDEIGLLFDRYYRGTQQQSHGLGLGLYIARQLVEAHRGHIGVDSEPGSGSTFWFTLPAAPKYLS
jgi:signal transduction histidine kinase